eukprot:GHRR01023658.1.p1 GENE.GHRR01023658.1~~GHRR01023658.1.p1  ORF type:complete len:113 (-),score=11.05 GHRR01023658.1:404-742(-)
MGPCCNDHAELRTHRTTVASQMQQCPSAAQTGESQNLRLYRQYVQSLGYTITGLCRVFTKSKIALKRSKGVYQVKCSLATIVLPAVIQQRSTAQNCPNFDTQVARINPTLLH